MEKTLGWYHFGYRALFEYKNDNAVLKASLKIILIGL